MAEPEKENISVEPKLKKVLLDEEIGKEFLSSWKSMSVTEYDGMDFNFGNVGKGERNAFNFDKLDMDFNLDGDFNKLSSFKVEMPEIDFSCPLKKSAKPKDGNAEESTNGNGQRKKETFSFSFDFNEMDAFSFDSSLMKGEKTPQKDSVSKEVASVKLDHQGTKIHLSRDFASYDDNDERIPAAKSVEASRIVNSEAGIAELASMRTNFLEPANLGIKALENEERACLGMKMIENPEESDQQGCFLGQAVQTGTCAQNEDVTTLESNSKVPKEVCYSGKTLNSNTGRNQNICDNMVYEDPSCPKSLQSVDQHASDNSKSLDDAKNMNLLGIVTFRDSMDCIVQGQGQLDIEDAPTENSSKKTQSDAKFDQYDKILGKELDLATVNREAAANQMTPINSKESGRICSKFFKSVGVNVNQSNKEPVLVQIGRKRHNGINTNPSEKIRGSTCRDAGQKSKAVNNFDNFPREQKEGLTVAETSKIDSHTSKTGLLSSFNSKETSKTLDVQTCLGAERTDLSTEAIGNSRITSLSKNKLCSISARAARNVSSLSILRAPGSAVKQPGSRTIVGTPLTKNSEESTETQKDSGKLTLHPGGSSEKEKKLMQSPSLKRKSYEMSNASAVSCSPLKRLSESPVEISPRDSLQKSVVSRQIRKACCENMGDVKSRNVSAENSPSPVEIPTLKNIVDYEITASVENDVNLEEAEAYAKELEELCIMLKKKQDEAKELLVRAIVNNNHLLMLNHPIFERKTVQKFASQLMAKAVGK